MILVGEPLGAPTHNRLPESLGIERDLVAASGTVFLAGLGEELWKKLLPKYLESLGAGVAVAGFVGASVDFLDALYQFPGGWLADHWGRRQAFLTFLFAAPAAIERRKKSRATVGWISRNYLPLFLDTTLMELIVGARY